MSFDMLRGGSLQDELVCPENSSKNVTDIPLKMSRTGSNISLFSPQQKPKLLGFFSQSLTQDRGKYKSGHVMLLFPCQEKNNIVKLGLGEVFESVKHLYTSWKNKNK
ncbi:hypothetical protein GOODEAATRI_017796 [Goodea atripinnis]|uniref:Uncharacterized protein n=1 Tax=Goodea atripinnis TaxID=208336 RepID=A0ABV0MUW5_9TELE